MLLKKFVVWVSNVIKKNISNLKSIFFGNKFATLFTLYSKMKSYFPSLFLGQYHKALSVCKIRIKFEFLMLIFFNRRTLNWPLRLPAVLSIHRVTDKIEKRLTFANNKKVYGTHSLKKKCKSICNYFCKVLLYAIV